MEALCGGCDLTLRSSGPPPAWPDEALRNMFRFAGPRRRRPLSSNVRPHTTPTSNCGAEITSVKIQFHCPSCGYKEAKSVWAVGWSRIEHSCTRCQWRSVHKYRSLPAAGLGLLGVFASWAVALAAREAFNLSANATSLVGLACLAIIALSSSSRLVNACSSWEALPPNSRSSSSNPPDAA